MGRPKVASGCVILFPSYDDVRKPRFDSPDYERCSAVLREIGSLQVKHNSAQTSGMNHRDTEKKK
jgi:hypothetical protein